MVRELRVWLLAASLLSLSAGQAFAVDAGPDPRLVNPIGLGPNYTGPVRAGMGITHTDTAFGFKAGDFIIQPRFLFENEFVSNFFKVDTRNDQTEEIPAFTFHLRPGVGIHNPSAKALKLRFSTDVDVFLPASSSKSVTNQANVGLALNAGVSYTIKRLMSFRLNEQFTRDLLIRALSASGGSSNRNRNSLGADIIFHPGGGALEFELGYAWNALLYDSLTQLNYHEHRLGFKASWRFLPLSYLFLDTRFSVHDYMQDRTEQEKDSSAAGNRPNGMPFKVYAGFSGYLTTRIAVMLRLGYGNSLLEEGENFSSFIGDARVSFRFSPRTALHVGGGRDFNLAGLGGYVDMTRTFVSFEQSIADLILLHVDLGFDYRYYGAWEPAVVETEINGTISRTTSSTNARHRQDFVLRAGLLADFEFSRLFGLSFGYRFEADLTDYAVTTTTANLNSGSVSSPVTTFQGYMDHRLFLTLNLRY
ncbi:MAG: hypothetical protein QF412_05840 [Planctomycetota bacterium]|jgi:hypothetical protein|nr:hypothetical protein [Planctomycetota bacterium]